MRRGGEPWEPGELRGGGGLWGGGKPRPGARRPGEAGPQREARDDELAGEGWMRRFTGAPPRLREVKDLYETLGLEVLLDDLSPEELPEDCSGCAIALSLFQVVYTRRPPEGRPELEGGSEPAGKPESEPANESGSKRGSEPGRRPETGGPQ